MLAPATLKTDESWDLWLASRRFAEAESTRLAGYERHWKYYSGEHDMSLPVRPGQANDNISINLARYIVEKGVAFLFGKDLRFDCQLGQDSPEQDYLDMVWQRNKKMTLLNKVAQNGAIYGTAFVKLIPDWHGENLPRIVNLDPEYVSVLVDDEDVDTAHAYVIQWLAQDERRRGVHKREVIRREQEPGQEPVWQVEYHVNRGKGPGGTGGVWIQDPDRDPFTWNYPWPPIAHCQNMPVTSSLYGLSDLEDLDEQDAINYVASKINRIIRYHAHPKTVAIGIARGQDIQLMEDDLMVLPSEKSSISNLEMASDLSATLQFFDRLVSWRLGTARMPRVDPAMINVGSLSGFALRVLYGDLLEKNAAKQRTYGDMLQEVNRRLLDMGGFGPDYYEVQNVWQDPLPEDPQEVAARDQMELDYGISSKETVQRRRGIDPEREADRIAEQEAASGNIGALLLKSWENQTGSSPGARLEPAQ